MDAFFSLPITTTWAENLGGEGQADDPEGYVCYTLPGCPSNEAATKPGFGATERAALLDATYWGPQAAWVRVDSLSQAPAWARRVYRDKKAAQG